MVASNAPVDVAVIGSGIVGLYSAMALAAAGRRVVVVAAEPPPRTVSAIAGGFWSPFQAGPPEAVARWSRFGYDAYERLATDTAAAGVRMVDARLVVDDENAPVWWESCAPDGAGRPATAVERPHGVGAARVIRVPVVDTARHLDWLLERLEAAGVRSEHLRLDSLDAAFDLAPTVVACPGLAARELLDDDAVHAIRGVVVVVAHPGAGELHPILDDRGAHPTYVLPRTDGTVLLGGRVDVGDERREATTDEVEDIVARCTELVPELAGAQVTGVKIGLRPGRRDVRVEQVAHARGRLIVNYGHGGCGWTLAAGCAQDVVELA